MTSASILEKLGTKGADIEGIAESLLKDKRQIRQLVEALKIEKSPKKYAYEKTLRRLSEKKPECVYPYFEVFVEMLDNENSFLKWGAIMTLANLTTVDTEKKFEKIFRKYYEPIRGPVMITAGNIIGSSSTIVRAKPELGDAIAREILKVEKAEFLHKGIPSPECRNVAIGQAIDTFDQIFDFIGPRVKVENFVKRQLNNTRKQVVKKAEKFMKKYAG
jgi:hypothetical protein